MLQQLVEDASLVVGAPEMPGASLLLGELGQLLVKSLGTSEARGPAAYSQLAVDALGRLVLLGLAVRQQAAGDGGSVAKPMRAATPEDKVRRGGKRVAAG